mmetsp:Transcript_19032/g.41013  ORF Transcript_19032/g.41013 Transcript_19032/m.41013 type:complete len:274 (+) Transcript_19032:399-1220(+)
MHAISSMQSATASSTAGRYSSSSSKTIQDLPHWLLRPCTSGRPLSMHASSTSTCLTPAAASCSYCLCFVPQPLCTHELKCTSAGQYTAPLYRPPQAVEAAADCRLGRLHLHLHSAMQQQRGSRGGAQAGPAFLPMREPLPLARGLHAMRLRTSALPCSIMCCCQTSPCCPCCQASVAWHLALPLRCLLNDEQGGAGGMSGSAPAVSRLRGNTARCQCVLIAPPSLNHRPGHPTAPFHMLVDRVCPGMLAAAAAAAAQAPASQHLLCCLVQVLR